MRARYAAYALGKPRFVMDTTTEPRTDTDAWRAEIHQFCEHTAFTGLSIVEAAPVPAGANEAYVTFAAALEQGGRDAGFTERSRFVRRVDPDGVARWTYADGERLA